MGRSTTLGEASDWRIALAEHLERQLWQHVIEPWFPRVVDHAHGGFHSGLDRRWQLLPDEPRSLESQARQTRTVARLGIAYPDQPRWREYTTHGLGYLRQALRDEVEGGYFWVVDRTGRPGAGGSKHAHGLAYLLGAAAEARRLTGAAEALAIADEVFDWLEAHHHDGQHGGYLGWVRRDGRAILSEADTTPDMGGEPLGNPPGRKDSNTHSDLLGALGVLATLGDASPLVRTRLDELLAIVTERLIAPDGRTHYLCQPDWTPVPGPERFGYAFQFAPRMLAAGELLGRPAAPLLEQVRRMVDHAVERGWRAPAGGFAFADRAPAPGEPSAGTLPAGERQWWVQTEAFRTLVMLALLDGGGPRYRQLAEGLLEFIERNLIDARHLGWLDVPLERRPAWKRLLRPREHKATMWKDASHEADMYLDAIRLLRGLAPTDPLAPAGAGEPLPA